MSGTFKGLRIYNTLSRSKEDFVPFDDDHVRMYVCGPTVYDYAHIGNARPVIVFDVLFRLLRHLYGDDHVTYVRNITDVDDKINARARETFPDLALNEAIRKVTEATARQFHEDVAALGCLQPTIEPRATETIPEMVSMIGDLIERGHAYEAEGHVLFDVKSWKAADGSSEYGKLSRRSLDDMIAGARVEVAPYKRDPMDFVLWKPSSPEEPGWESPWGRGRPGWHIECSAMSDKWLWEEVKATLSPDAQAHPHEFDIHGGGIDLTFPHHENEIAQSRCAHGTAAMARYWMHNGFLQVEGQKMSKSLGNFVTINELLQEWSGPAIRSVMLQTHYRQPINWTIDKLRLARDELAEWAEQVFDTEILGQFELDLFQHRRRPIDERVVAPLLDDLNTVEAFAGVRALFSESKKDKDAKYALLNAAEFLGLLPLRKIGALLTDRTSGSAPIMSFSEHRELYLAVQAASANANVQAIQSANSKVAALGLVFNVSPTNGWVTLDKAPSHEAAGDDIQEQINRRLAFIREKNWAEADKIRDELLAQGIQLKDGKDPETGERVTTWEVKR